MQKNAANFLIAVNWKDRWHLPACVASIRKFYPDARISLLKDNFRGHFSTTRLEKRLNVSVQPVARSFGGGGWIKLLPAILGEKSSGFDYPLMVLDADTLLLGPVFEEVAAVAGTLVVSPDLYAAISYSEDYISKTYLNPDRLLQLGMTSEALKRFPWFNSGHLLLRAPFLPPDFVEKWIDWEAKPVCRRDPALYPLTDQSLLNHFLLQNPGVKMGLLDFASWAGDQQWPSQVKNQTVFAISKFKVLHYAGFSGIPFWTMPYWRVFSKLNLAAEMAMGQPGWLFVSHASHHYLGWVLDLMGQKQRERLKRWFVEK